MAVLENPGQDNHDRRTQGFVARIESKHPGVKVVSRAASLQDPQKAYQAVLTMAQAHPNLGAVFMPEASSAMGAAQAAKELGGKIKVLCCDVNVKVLDMIKETRLLGIKGTRPDRSDERLQTPGLQPDADPLLRQRPGAGHQGKCR